MQLLRMGILTGCAIAIHNIPEGLATFVGAMNDTKAGGSIAAAIAIHNIPGVRWVQVNGLCNPFSDAQSRAGAQQRLLPVSKSTHDAEGICVAMPIYYATGSKLKVCEDFTVWE
jgi:ZIP family zinc transporter